MKARGYFGIGVEGISKPNNFGNLSRTAYGFGASFVFTVSPGKRFQVPDSDTTRSDEHMPWYTFDSLDTMQLPDDCRLVGIELTDDAIELQSFRHPTKAAYVLGPENGSLSPEMTARCEFIVKIPTLFCLNVATAGAVIMYDRMACLGRYAERPVKVGGPVEDMKPHHHGKPTYRAGTKVPAKKGRDRTTVVGTRAPSSASKKT